MKVKQILIVMDKKDLSTWFVSLSEEEKK